MISISDHDSEDLYDQPLDLVDELTQRALLIHDRSYRGGSFSQFYDSHTKNVIRLLVPVLVREALAVSSVHGRPQDKLLRAAAKALAAVQTAIAQREEDLKR